MKIIIGCEFSGIVRQAFSALGHDAWSCDIIPTEIPGQHIMDDVRNVLDWGWDMMIAFPPCTYLANSGARWLYEDDTRREKQRQALDFVRTLMYAPIDRIAIENPKGAISTAIRKPDCIFQPHEHGHGETKETHLWLKNLPAIYPTNIVPGREQRIWRMPPSDTRQMERSRTYAGVARAFAEQWGSADMPMQLEMFRADVPA